MSRKRLKQYRRLQDSKRTKTVKKQMNNVKARLYMDVRKQVAQLSAIGEVIGYGDVIDELQRAIELMKVEQKY